MSTKKCPKCAEKIQKEATICKYCGSEILLGGSLENFNKKAGEVGKIVRKVVLILLCLLVFYMIYKLSTPEGARELFELPSKLFGNSPLTK